MVKTAGSDWQTITIERSRFGLEDDAPDSLLKRIKGSLPIKGNLDEYQTWLMSKENLSLLNYPYKEEDFSK